MKNSVKQTSESPKIRAKADINTAGYMNAGHRFGKTKLYFEAEKIIQTSGQGSPKVVAEGLLVMAAESACGTMLLTHRAQPIDKY